MELADEVAVEVESCEAAVHVLDGIGDSSRNPDLALCHKVIRLLPHQKLGPPLQHKEKLQQKMTSYLENITAEKVLLTTSCVEEVLFSFSAR